MADIRVVCPCCGVSLRAKEQLAGQTIRCPKCVSLVPIKAADGEFAQLVETNYEAVPLEEDNVGRVCPKCSTSLKPGGKLCKNCGWHLDLETYFEDLKDDNLIVHEEPKTKWETWFENQLHESSRPRDVLNFSAIAGGIASVILLAVAHFRFGFWGVAFMFLVLIGGWIGWYRIMQLIGLLHDPTRKRILAKEKAQREATPETPSSAPAEPAAVRPAQVKRPTFSGKPKGTPQPLSFDLPDAEVAAEAKTKPQPAPKKQTPAKPAAAAPERKVVRPASTNQPATAAAKPQPKPAAPAPAPPKPAPEAPAKPKASDDDWLDDLL